MEQMQYRAAIVERLSERTLTSSDERIIFETSKKFAENGGGDMEQFVNSCPAGEVASKTKIKLSEIKESVSEKSLANRLLKLKVPNTEPVAKVRLREPS